MKKIGFAFGVSLLAASPTFASVPPQFTVQGVLRDEGGRLMSMTAHVTVSFYDAQDGGVLIAGPFGPLEVPAVNGLFTAVIGAPTLKTLLAASSAPGAWMEIVEGDTIFARQPVTSEIYAMAAGTAEQADGLSPACSGCVADSMIGGIAAGKIQGKVPAAITADSVANGLYSNMSYADPSWLLSLDGSKISGKVASAASADTVTDGVYEHVVYPNPGFVGSLDGAKINGTITSASIDGKNVIGQVGSAAFCGTAFGLVNGVYTSAKYDNPDWITALAGAKIEGSVGDAAGLGGIPAAGYQQALKSSCSPGSWVSAVAQDGTVTCGGGAVTASGGDFGHALRPNGSNVVGHLLLTAPSAGFLVVTASYAATADNSSAGGPIACRLESSLDVAGHAPAKGPGYQAMRFPATYVTRDGDGNLVSVPGAITTRIPVAAAGAVSVYFNGASDCTDASWSDVMLTATFQPGPDATVGFVTP